MGALSGAGWPMDHRKVNTGASLTGSKSRLFFSFGPSCPRLLPAHLTGDRSPPIQSFGLPVGRCGTVRCGVLSPPTAPSGRRITHPRISFNAGHRWATTGGECTAPGSKGRGAVGDGELVPIHDVQA